VTQLPVSVILLTLPLTYTILPITVGMSRVETFDQAHLPVLLRRRVYASERARAELLGRGVPAVCTGDAAIGRVPR